MYYHPEIETLARVDLEQLQLERLQTTLNRVYRNVAFYKRIFDERKVDIARIRDIRDLALLPFTTRADLGASYPYSMFAVPLRDIIRIHSTSGTTGKAVVVGYTRNDIRAWSEMIARLLVAAGLTNHDIVQIAFDYGLFTGGFGFHYGAERLGATVIPTAASDNLARQVMIMRDFRTTALLCTPSYALLLAQTIAEQGVHPEQLQLRLGVFGAEPWSDAFRAQLEERLRITALDAYGLSEIMGPGVAGECAHKNGLHINEDHFIAEVIDPQTLDPLPAGTPGELVFTTITKEGFPLIRYRTGDIAALLPGACACGRTMARMSRITGRTDDLLFLNGTKIFPSQIEVVLLAVEGLAPNYRIVIDRAADGSDAVEIQVEVSGASPAFDEIRALEQLRQRLMKKLASDLALTAKVAFVEPKSLKNTGGGKISRVLDRRQR